MTISTIEPVANPLLTQELIIIYNTFTYSVIFCMISTKPNGQYRYTGIEKKLLLWNAAMLV